MDDVIDISFINDEMSAERKCVIWKQEYFKICQQLQEMIEEKRKVEMNEKFGMKVVENLKYQIDNKNSQYLAEQRSSQYLRLECGDLQTEVQNLRNMSTENTADVEEVVNIVHDAWEKHVVQMIEEKPTPADMNTDLDMNMDMDIDVNHKTTVQCPNCQILTNEVMRANAEVEIAIQSKLDLIHHCSMDMQNMRQMVIEHFPGTRYKKLLDRVVRYHGLIKSEEDQLYQLMVDAGLTDDHFERKYQKRRHTRKTSISSKDLKMNNLAMLMTVKEETH